MTRTGICLAIGLGLLLQACDDPARHWTLHLETGARDRGDPDAGRWARADARFRVPETGRPVAAPR